LTPTPTLHVNTQMLYYTEGAGTQGYASYLRAAGNTLVPEFLVGKYVFGTPLVTELHNRFGWRGQDFGMLAEAIYSDGVRAAFLVHFVAGTIAIQLFISWSKGNIAGGIFY